MRLTVTPVAGCWFMYELPPTRLIVAVAGTFSVMLGVGVGGDVV